MNRRKIPYKTLFSGQHEDLIKDFIDLIGQPDYSFENIITHGQSLNRLVSKIVESSDKLLNQNTDFKIIVQEIPQLPSHLHFRGFRMEMMLFMLRQV